MWADIRRFPCFCCGMTGLGVCLDKKGRPFMKCTMCGTIVFPRGGELAMCHAVNTARILEDNPDLASNVRRASFEAAATGTAVRDLLRPIASADLAPVASPAPEFLLPAKMLAV